MELTKQFLENRDFSMKVDFQYSTDFLAMNAPELSDTCMHLLCTAGEGSFVFNERCYHIVKNDLVVIPMPARVSNIAAHADILGHGFPPLRFLTVLC